MSYLSFFYIFSALNPSTFLLMCHSLFFLCLLYTSFTPPLYFLVPVCLHHTSPLLWPFPFTLRRVSPRLHNKLFDSREGVWNNTSRCLCVCICVSSEVIYLAVLSLLLLYPQHQVHRFITQNLCCCFFYLCHCCLCSFFKNSINSNNYYI